MKNPYIWAMKPKKQQSSRKALPLRRGPKPGSKFLTSITAERRSHLLLLLGTKPEGATMKEIIAFMQGLPSPRPDGKPVTPGSLRTFMGQMLVGMTRNGELATCGGVGKATVYALVDHSPCAASNA
jgi:hypothetical protein